MKKTVIILSLFICVIQLFAQSEKKYDHKGTIKKTAIIFSILALIAGSCGQVKTPTTQEEMSFHNDTLFVNGLQLIKINNNDTNRPNCLTTINGDTIAPFANYYRQMEFLDIDEDGLPTYGFLFSAIRPINAKIICLIKSRMNLD